MPVVSYLKAGLLGALLCVITGCDSSSSVSGDSQYSGRTMGTTWSIKAVGECSLEQKAIDDRLVAINQIASTYIEDSELSVLNRVSRPGLETKISDELAEIISLAIEIDTGSGGAFDVTVGPVVNLWGFGPEFRSTPPSEYEISKALALVGSDAISLSNGVIQYEKQRAIDLSAIAKGWGVDQLGAMLDQAGCKNYLAEIGGELLAKGSNNKGKPWRLAVEKPTQAGRQAMQLIAVTDAAVATSGDYRNYYEFDGKRYSHTINPKTGKPVDHQVASVTVVASTSAQADAWATALNVTGVEKGLQLAEQEGLAVMFIEYEGETLKITANNAFKALMR